MNNPELSIILITYNSAKYLRDYFDSICKYLSKVDLQLIVVDNDSSDTSVEIVKREFPSAYVIQNHDNLGYSRAINAGLEYVNAPITFIMNADTEIITDLYPAMKSLLDADDNIGALGCRLVYPDNSPQRSYFNFPTITGRIAYYTGLTKAINVEKLAAKNGNGNGNKPFEVDVVCGAFMAFKTELLKKFDGFDPDYFLYHEEADLCYRLNKSGYKNYINPTIQIIHHGSNVEYALNERVYYHRNRSLLIYFRKNRSKAAFFLFWILNFGFNKVKYFSTFLPIRTPSIRRFKRKVYFSVLKYHLRFIYKS